MLVVSDHGARPMQGAICVNEWLVQEGYLVLEETPQGPTPFSEAKVDWSRTRAWGEGGYYCRLCLNVAGREPQGTVAGEDYEALLDELAERLEQLPGPDGEPIGTRVLRPQELWREQRGIPPDLVVYFGDLGWRSNGSLGHGRHWTYENDTGPDDANHDRNGLCIIAGPGVPAQQREDLDDLRRRADDPRPGRPRARRADARPRARDRAEPYLVSAARGAPLSRPAARSCDPWRR